MAQHDVGVDADLRQQRNGDGALHVCDRRVLFIGVELPLRNHGQIFEQLRAHLIARKPRNRLAHGADGSAGVHDTTEIGSVRVVLMNDDLSREAIRRRDRSHGAKHEARCLQPMRHQCGIDDRFELLRGASLAARHIRQRRAHRIGTEQTGEEDQRIQADRDSQREIGEAVAILERVPVDDEAMRLVITVELQEVDLGAQLIGIAARQAAVGQAFPRKAEQLIRCLILAEAIAAGAFRFERPQAGVEPEYDCRRLARLLGIAVDAAGLRLRRRRAGHGADELGADLLHAGQALHGRFLAEIGAGAFESPHHAAWIDARAVVAARRIAGQPDALLRGIGFAFQLGEIAVDRRQLSFDLGDAAFDRLQPTLRIPGALLANFILVPQLGQFRHALAIDRPAALLAGAFDAAVLSHRFHALGVDLFLFCVEFALVLGKFGCQPRPLTPDAAQFLRQRRLLALQGHLAALRGGHALLLGCNTAPTLFHLLQEVAFDLARSVGRVPRQ